MYEKRVKIGAVLVAAGGIVLAAYLQSRLVGFWQFTTADVVRILTPLVLIALFMERALEVMLTPWRADDADRLAQQIGEEKERVKAAGLPSSKTLEEMTRQLGAHKAQTRQLAFIAGLALGTVISALGIRALQPFADPAGFAALPNTQRMLFNGVDVLVSGALLAGGADGLHKLVLVFTNFFDATSARVKAAPQAQAARP